MADGNVTTPSETPPPATPTGGNSLLPTQKLVPRTVVNTSPDFKTTANDFDAQGRYIGQGLVDKNGVITRGQYGNEAYAQLAEFKSVAERKNFLNRLYQVGLYQGSKPSQTGFASKDIAAMQDALDWANWRGYTIDVAATMMATELGTVTNAGNRIRTTSKEDLRSVFKQTASSILGRTLSDSEVEKFVKSYNQKEVSEAMGGASAPTAATAAEQAVTAAAPDEAAAMGASTLMDLFDQKIKGLG
jgi:ribosomal protein L12E/L44/L45/RPP1/RPP2